jgi:hypothetical protein
MEYKYYQFTSTRAVSGNYLIMVVVMTETCLTNNAAN